MKETAEHVSHADPMQLSRLNEATVFQFAHLARFEEIWHAVFTREKGYSKGVYRSLNTSYGVGDLPVDVARNRQIIASGNGTADFIFPKQVHGDRIAAFTARNPGPPSDALTGGIVADALVSDIARQYLVIQVADCQSIFLYDPGQTVVANIHCGWRGSIANIAGQTVEKMQQEFGTSPRHIVAGIGPSLGPCCAEFIHYRREIPAAFWSYRVEANHFDFWSITRDQLRHAGVPAENIVCSRLCTKCHPELFFSYRGEGRTGRFATVIGIR